MRVLDIGCGERQIGREIFPDAEYVGVDLSEDIGADVIADVREIPGNLGKFDVVIASHVLEHVQRKEVIPTLKHWGTFLAPEGKLFVLVPDLLWAAQQIVEGAGQVKIATLLHMYGSGDSLLRQHYIGFTVPTLRQGVEMAGLVVIQAEVGPYQLSTYNRDGEEKLVDAMQISVAAVLPQQEETWV